MIVKTFGSQVLSPGPVEKENFEKREGGVREMRDLRKHTQWHAMSARKKRHSKLGDLTEVEKKKVK